MDNNKQTMETEKQYWKKQLLKIYMDGEITPMIKHQIKLIENDQWGNWLEMKVFCEQHWEDFSK